MVKSVGDRHRFVQFVRETNVVDAMLGAMARFLCRSSGSGRRKQITTIRGVCLNMAPLLFSTSL